MRNLFVAALGLAAPFFLWNYPASADECEIKVTPELLNPESRSQNTDLGKAIVCVALPITENASTGKPSPDDAAAAKAIVILANKIIGNGSPVASKTPKLLTPAPAKTASMASTTSTASGGASRQKRVASDQTLSLATMIKCRALALAGDKPASCASADWSKNEVIVAGIIIGNG